MFVSLSLFSCETSELPGGGTVTVRYILKTQVGYNPEVEKHKFDISITLLFNQPGTRGKYTLIINPGPGLAICKVAYPHLERFWVNWALDSWAPDGWAPDTFSGWTVGRRSPTVQGPTIRGPICQDPI